MMMSYVLGLGLGLCVVHSTQRRREDYDTIESLCGVGFGRLLMA